MQRRLTPVAQRAMVAPATTALIALRLGRGNSQHYHTLAAMLMIGYRIAETVQRHRHLMPDLQAALNTLASMFDRWQQRTVPDAAINGTPEEVDTLELAVNIHAALLQTCPVRTVRRAMLNVNSKIEGV